MHLDFTFFADTVYTSVYNRELMQFYRSATPIRIMLVDCIANTDNLSWTISFLVWMASRSLSIGRYKALRTTSGSLFLVPLSFIV